MTDPLNALLKRVPTGDVRQTNEKPVRFTAGTVISNGGGGRTAKRPTAKA